MKTLLTTSMLTVACALSAGVPDSVYVRPYGNEKGQGLFLEWSSDGKQWSQELNDCILTSDYGPWGKGKKMYAPSWAAGEDGMVALVFQVNDRAEQFGVTCTRDLVHWRPQDYPFMPGAGQCLSPEISYDGTQYTVVFHNREGRYFATASSDLVNFSKPREVEAASHTSEIRIPRATLERLTDYQTAFNARSRMNNETAAHDSMRFAKLKEVRADIVVDASQPKEISDKLMGVFFEDINYSADGGLNAELVQNGDFEYTPHDTGGKGKWNQTTAWELRGDATLDLDARGISENNPHAVGLKVSEEAVGASLRNTGWDGIVLRKGAKYDLSLWLRGGKAHVTLLDGEKELASTTVAAGEQWKKCKATLIAKADCDSAVLDIRPLQQGETVLDMVSLMPEDTYKGHGLRKDLAETIAALNPKFLRFPGGCLVHGDGLGNMYHWKETIGPLEDRKPQRNLWGYHQSRRIGYYEFFQMCEDMGMEPLPVVAAGVPCANSSDGGGGQQGGIPMDEMGQYVQDVLDLIEWANGDASTVWGSKRIAQGHKKPFGLKMIGIGNEDLISPTFTERYLMLCRAVKEKYPDITICGTVGPFYYGSDYDEGWRLANENSDIIDMVDEHYYLPPGWFVNNQSFYDQYDRSAPKVYLGEWAAQNKGRKSTVETALAEALYFCSLERNGDVVTMSSYAPLLANVKHTQWRPDMIYFSNTEVKPTVSYYAHKMWGNSQGDRYLPSTVALSDSTPGLRERIAVSAVKDSKTGKAYLKLVNMLPKEVEAHLTLSGLLDDERQCKTTTLSGRYDSEKALPKEGEATLSPDCLVKLPAYSFTLVEL
ncbi:MAG: alpha-L-arabinofuranosidase [Prevotellaceae bacterium]|nr:alpha-L-arabinofuranosidase [Prevotellaceae bacterium]